MTPETTSRPRTVRPSIYWHTLLLASITLVVSSSLATGQDVTTPEVTRKSMDHSKWTVVLKRFVDSRGDVAYDSLHEQADSLLTPYLHELASAQPSTLDRDSRLALWINAYNALTLKLVLQHYPVTSIQDIDGPDPEKTPFQRPVGEVADTVRTLDEIEHEIIRERFDEPRIHFALVCAAKSCPRLRREAYTGPTLDKQLRHQSVRFLHNKRRNRIPAGSETIKLSSIFKWYGEDFGPDEDALQRFLAPYFEGAVRKSLREATYEVSYLPYDWTLNDQALDWGESAAGSGDS